MKIHNQLNNISNLKESNTHEKKKNPQKWRTKGQKQKNPQVHEKPS